MKWLVIISLAVGYAALTLFAAAEYMSDRGSHALPTWARILAAPDLLVVGGICVVAMKVSEVKRAHQRAVRRK